MKQGCRETESDSGISYKAQTPLTGNRAIGIPVSSADGKPPEVATLMASRNETLNRPLLDGVGCRSL